MKFPNIGWGISKAFLALWPILLLPGVMSLAASPRGWWRTCTSSWFAAFLCTSVWYPMLIALMAWVVLPLARTRNEGLARGLGWLPAAVMVLTGVLAWTFEGG